ncbi:hypothetical protein L9F63_009301, partial [Diploptera punctata]
ILYCLSPTTTRVTSGIMPLSPGLLYVPIYILSLLKYIINIQFGLFLCTCCFLQLLPEDIVLGTLIEHVDYVVLSGVETITESIPIRKNIPFIFFSHLPSSIFVLKINYQ